ncbi:hypothetical protein [Pseudoduganella namucuonensis]|uniref:Uncharacterized protein n=1 Tax=Pseudoduganella namucuonensis TaxID=1035707 RepID=A0A1I7LZM5_9BURK|nr:hypothetical protein [Pseudoduganella namucuonensis]SFV15010.1 hypothetical protein SAMN05216552_104429 [Pseudoduganella namucuonensis]
MHDDAIPTTPTKQQVRDWLRTRWMMSMPLPDAEALRREVGWKRAEPAPAGNAAPKESRS